MALLRGHRLPRRPGLVSCPGCGGFAEVLLSPAPDGIVEVGHCLHRDCLAWFSLPWAA